MTFTNNRAPLPSIIKLSFHNQLWIQTEVTVRKRLSWVVTSVTLTFDLWPWAFAWTLPWSLVITPENFMMIRWWEHSQKVRQTDGRTDRRTKNTIHRAAWSQLKNYEYMHFIILGVVQHENNPSSYWMKLTVLYKTVMVSKDDVHIKTSVSTDSHRSSSKTGWCIVIFSNCAIPVPVERLYPVGRKGYNKKECSAVYVDLNLIVGQSNDMRKQLRVSASRAFNLNNYPWVSESIFTVILMHMSDKHGTVLMWRVTFDQTYIMYILQCTPN